MLESIIDIVRRAGELVRSANDVTAATHEKNGPADLVTEYDLAVQRFLRQELLALLPEADFFGEEGQHNALTSPWTFIVDPIDGTTNFVRGFAYTNISVALAKDGQVEYAVVYAPLAGELYAARRGGGPGGGVLRVSAQPVGFRRREPAGAGGRGLRHHAGGDGHRSPAPRLRVRRQRPVRRADGGAAPWIRGIFSANI